MTTTGRLTPPAPRVRRATRLTRLTLIAAGLALAASACSTGSGRGSFAGNGPTTTATTAATTSAADKPKFASEFERTCSDGLGFGGVAAYSRAAKAVHPAVLLSRRGSDTWSQQVPFSDEYPAGWIVGYTGDLSRTELVVCYERTGATPAGRTCQMTDDKTHEQFSMTMFNTRYRLRVLSARTGEVLYDKTGQATSTDCPTLTFVGGNDDRTKYYTDADPRDYRGALRPFIAP
jgi:hypothetical protein